MDLLRHSVSLLLAAGSALGTFAATAQEFPTRPVRIVVPFPAGGSFDLTARIIAQRAQLGQNVIVENRPGGGTVIGTEHANQGNVGRLPIRPLMNGVCRIRDCNERC